jgi:hypothetical protein
MICTNFDKPAGSGEDKKKKISYFLLFCYNLALEKDVDRRAMDNGQSENLT